MMAGLSHLISIRQVLICVVLLVMLLGVISCASSSKPPPVGMTTTSPITPSTTSASSPALPTGTAILDVPGTMMTVQPKQVAPPQGYRIGAEDLLRIEVFGVEALTRSVRVNSVGQISMPLIGLVQAAGLTAEELAADIAVRLSQDFLQNPQVTIFIEEFTSQRVTVVGAVNKPGVFPIKGRTTLLQVVAAAGQPTRLAKGDTVKVLRTRPDGGRQMLEYDLQAIMEGQAQDPEVLAEDVVHVETSAVKQTAKDIIDFVRPFWFLRGL